MARISKMQLNFFLAHWYAFKLPAKTTLRNFPDGGSKIFFLACKGHFLNITTQAKLSFLTQNYLCACIVEGGRGLSFPQANCTMYV